MTQAFNLSQLANNLNTAGQLDATDGLVNAVPVANGGTGASTVAAAVSNLSASIYPVGSVYINAAVNTNPGTLLGFGTWVAFGAGRVMVGLNVSDVAFDVLQETGGNKDATLVSHSHTATSTVSDPGHFHNYPKGGASSGPRDAVSIDTNVNTDFNSSTDLTTVRGTDIKTTGVTVATTVASAGSSATNANLQPYITVCMWLRTA